MSPVASPIGQKSYVVHGEQKRAQIDQVIRYAESNQCRMSALVRHFGDFADGETACGLCDFCAPARCIAQRLRTATPVERAALFRVIAALRSGDAKSTDKLHSQLFLGEAMSRDSFE
jgi:superfamily II DNA helicase RecQ